MISIMTWLTGSRASESVWACITWKGVQNDGIVLQPLWIELIQKRRLIFNSTVGHETVTYLSIFLVKTKVKVHTFILNYLIGWYDKYGLTREPDNILLSSLLIYFCEVDWLASQRVRSCVNDLLSGLSWRYGYWLLIAQKIISKFQRFRNR